MQFEQQLSMLGKECDHRRFDIEDRNVREEILDRTADDTHIDARTQETFAISLGTLCAVAARSLELCWAYLSHDG